MNKVTWYVLPQWHLPTLHKQVSTLLSIISPGTCTASQLYITKALEVQLLTCRVKEVKFEVKPSYWSPTLAKGSTGQKMEKLEPRKASVEKKNMRFTVKMQSTQNYLNRWQGELFVSNYWASLPHHRNKIKKWVKFSKPDVWSLLLSRVLVVVEPNHLYNYTSLQSEQGEGAKTSK